MAFDVRACEFVTGIKDERKGDEHSLSSEWSSK